MPSVIGIALFGSRARGDHSDGSDVDLLLWTSDGSPQHHKEGMLSLSFYARSELLERAANGDLFASHLVHEAVPVWDPRGLLEELRAAFRIKPSYHEIIRNAEDLGYYLLLNTPLIEPSLLNRRVAWVVRTILIARMIERSKLTFAPSELIEGLGAYEVFPLLAAKDDKDVDQSRLDLLRGFLKRWGVRQHPPRAATDYEALFRATGNSFGLKTMMSAAEATWSAIYA
jgi:predicted nucleotidyltransferase